MNKNNHRLLHAIFFYGEKKIQLYYWIILFFCGPSQSFLLHEIFPFINLHSFAYLTELPSVALCCCAQWGSWEFLWSHHIVTSTKDLDEDTSGCLSSSAILPGHPEVTLILLSLLSPCILCRQRWAHLRGHTGRWNYRQHVTASGFVPGVTFNS